MKAVEEWIITDRLYTEGQSLQHLRGIVRKAKCGEQPEGLIYLQGQL